MVKPPTEQTQKSADKENYKYFKRNDLILFIPSLSKMIRQKR